MNAPPKSAVIVGAGIGGLAIANILAKAGTQVTICEQSTIAGGRAGILKERGFTFDTGPSWYLMPEVFEHYFSLLGQDLSKHLDLVKLDPAYRLFFEDAPPITIHANKDIDAQTFEQIEPGAGAALHRYLDRAADVYNLAMRHFLYTNFQNKTNLLHKDVITLLPRLASALSQPIHRYVSSFVHTPRLQQILEYPMVFLGTSPYDAPAMYSLMSHMDFGQGVFYPRGGMYKIIKALTSIGRDLGVQYRYNAPATQILLDGKQVSGVQLQDGTTLTADVVISNADLHFTETALLPQHAQTYPEEYWSKRTPSPSAILMYLGVRGSLPMLQHHNLLFTADWRQNFDAIYKHNTWPVPASMYLCKPSATDSSVAPAGNENLFVLVPIPAQTGVQAEADRYADLYLQQLADMIGVPDLADRIVYKKLFGPDDFARSLNAWRGTALGIAHTLRQSAFLRPANASRKVRGLYYVGGNTTPGIGLPMCLISAEVLYKRLIGDTSSGPLGGAVQGGAA